MADNNFDCGKCMKDCCTNLFFKFPLMIFSFVMIGIGSNAMTKESRDCASAEQMPLILVVGGSLIIAGVWWRNFLAKMCSCCAEKMKARECNVGGKMMKCGMQLVYDCFIVNVCILWCVISSIYVANNVDGTPFDSLKDEGESTIDPANKDVWQCSSDVYNMTILSIIMGYILAVLMMFFLVIGKLCCNVICCKACEDSSEGTVNAA